MSAPSSPARPTRQALGVARLACLFGWLLASSLPALSASAVSVTGTYESEGSIVETESDYKGNVSLRALLGLDFDLARGLRLAANVPRIEIEQRDRTLVIRAKDDRGGTEWSGKWERNGGFEPTKDGVKLLLRGRQGISDLCLFQFSTLNDGGALLVEVQRVQDSPSGPIGLPLGKYLFLRSAPPESARTDK